MFVAITNTPRDYAWGRPGGVSAALGRPVTAAIEAELWLGAHHGSPSAIVEPDRTGGARTLAEWIVSDPRTALGSRHDRFPFLLKVLSAQSPLSLQAHPTAEQARAGFEREEAAGIPLDAPHRNYKDPLPKPELILAISDEFEALCGFRPAAESAEALDRLAELAAGADPGSSAGIRRFRDRLSGDDSIRAAFEWLIAGGDGVAEVVEAVASLALRHREDFPVQAVLAEQYPGDPGIAISLLLNTVVLARGEALFLPAGNIHAYLRGTGIELMEASDNVLRGGLTPKHVDVAELSRVLDFTPRGIPWLVPEVPVPDVRVFRPDGVGFELIEFEGDGPCPLAGPAIAVCLDGAFEVEGRDSVRLDRGDIVYVTPDEGDLLVRGSGQLVVATVAG